MKEHRNPERTLVIKKTLTAGHTVMTLAHMIHKPQTPGAAVVHIFRFKVGKIIEMWDLCQEIPANSPNENGMF